MRWSVQTFWCCREDQWDNAVPLGNAANRKKRRSVPSRLLRENKGGLTSGQLFVALFPRPSGPISRRYWERDAPVTRF
jgi:hypothetical protein